MSTNGTDQGDIAVRVEGLGKQYRLGQTIDLASNFRESLMSFPRFFGRKTLGATKKAARRVRSAIERRDGGGLSVESESEGNSFWALRDLNFEIRRGEAVGIIGRNGAGKSTLLKILSRITTPTTGFAEIHGRMGSLLEVGTGFHEELTGRENIYLNGAILGMRKAEIDRKFDEIVAFAEVERFLDTPVKRYSSGMRIRLGFAVAAHLDPEILVIDEVLAVGDAEFQRRCLGKMEDIARGGRTVLFVSHNMLAVMNLCERAYRLDQGRIVDQGESREVAMKYLNEGFGLSDNAQWYQVHHDVLQKNRIRGFEIENIELLGAGGEAIGGVKIGDPLTIRIHYRAEKRFERCSFHVALCTEQGIELFRVNTQPISGFDLEIVPGRHKIDLEIKELAVSAGRYFVNIKFMRPGVADYVKLDQVVTFMLRESDYYGSGAIIDQYRGLILLRHQWRHA